MKIAIHLDTLLSNPLVNKEVLREIRKSIELNDTINIVYQSLWKAAKAVLGGKFIGLNGYLRKEEKPEFNNLKSHFRNLEKEKQHKSKASKKKEIIKVRSEILELKPEKW